MSEIRCVRNSVVRNSRCQKFNCQKFNVSEMALSEIRRFIITTVRNPIIPTSVIAPFSFCNDDSRLYLYSVDSRWLARVEARVLSTREAFHLFGLSCFRHAQALSCRVFDTRRACRVFDTRRLWPVVFSTRAGF